MKSNESRLSEMSSGLPLRAAPERAGAPVLMVLNVDISNADEISENISVCLPPLHEYLFFSP